MERVASKNIYYHMQNRQPLGICCMAQRTQTWALQQPRGVRWGWEVEVHGRDIGITMADSHDVCMEINTIF